MTENIEHVEVMITTDHMPRVAVMLGFVSRVGGLALVQSFCQVRGGLSSTLARAASPCLQAPSASIPAKQEPPPTVRECAR